MTLIGFGGMAATGYYLPGLSQDAIVSDDAATSNTGLVVFTGLNQALISDFIL